MTPQILPRLLGELSCAEFFATHHTRAPLVRRGTAAWLTALGTLDLCERLVQSPDVDFIVVRDGKPHGGPRPSLDEARRLFAEGYTWVLREADRGDADVAELGRALASEVHGFLNLHVYRTPRARGGFGWHLDPEEVFFLQTVGRKRMRLRENTLHPSPLPAAIPVHLAADRDLTPVQEWVLEPGDCLYLPGGAWHDAEALDEDTVSISVGVQAPARLDALSLVMSELAQDARWRARLPPAGRASPLSDEERLAAWSAAIADLGAEVQRRLAAPDLPARLYAATGWWRQRR